MEHFTVTKPPGAWTGRGTFDIQILGLDGVLRQGLAPAVIWERELSKELELLKAPVEAYYKMHAPVKTGPWADQYYTTPDAKKGQHLRDSISARKALKATTLELRMAWWGWLTIDGRAGQGPRDKVYRIELPGGGVIYRHRTNPIGQADPEYNPNSAENMKWAQHAYEDLKANNVFKNAALNAAKRFEYAVFHSGLGGVTRLMYQMTNKSEPVKPARGYASQRRESRHFRGHATIKDAYQHYQKSGPGRPSMHAGQVDREYAKRHRELLGHFREARAGITHAVGETETGHAKMEARGTTPLHYAHQALRKHEYRHSHALAEYHMQHNQHDLAGHIMEQYRQHSKLYGVQVRRALRAPGTHVPSKAAKHAREMRAATRAEARKAVSAEGRAERAAQKAAVRDLRQHMAFQHSIQAPRQFTPEMHTVYKQYQKKLGTARANQIYHEYLHRPYTTEHPGKKKRRR